MLTDAHKAEFQAQGYTRVRGLFSADEVAAYNAQQTEYYQGLVQPTAAEQTLNGYRMSRQRYVDAGAQVGRALAAFEHNGFVILIDDRQVERLDDMVILGPATVVTFLKLVPLVGG